jgi:membrane protein
VTDFLLRALRWPVLLAVIITALARLTGSNPAGANRAGNGSVSAASWRQPPGLWHPGCCPGTWYDATYGSLGAGIGLMTWMWVSSIVILLHQTARDHGPG